MTRSRPGWFFLSLRLDQPQRSTLEALAKQRNLTLSEVIRSLIEEAAKETM